MSESKNKPSDFSTSEDELEKFRESVDVTFLANLYSNDEAEKKCKNKPSLRNQNHQENFFNPFTLKVTPDFQRHVSKHLSRLLDELIDDTEIIFKRKKSKAGNLNSGVKLLFSSKDYLLPTTYTEAIIKSRPFAKKENLNSNDYKNRAKEVAVTPEWVLSQAETKYWAANTKGEIEVVKIDQNKVSRKCLKLKKIR